MDTPQSQPPLARPFVSLPDNATMLKARIRLTVTRLFKGYLTSFEEFVDLHDEAMKKLEAALPVEQHVLLDLAEYLTEVRLDAMRKRVLTDGNNVIRDLESDIDNLRLSAGPTPSS